MKISLGKSKPMVLDKLAINNLFGKWWWCPHLCLDNNHT
jgi:hypothetical protein